MYVLIQECGNDFRIESASESKPALRRRLKDRATEYVKNFFFEDNCDETSKAKGRQFLDELKNFSGDYWDDEDDYYHMSWRIVKVQYICKPAKKKKTIPVVMAFGEEIVGAIDDGQDVKEILDEYAGTDSLVVRKFHTEAEKKAYEQGLIDMYGWEKYIELTDKYNRKLRDAALGKKKEFLVTYRIHNGYQYNDPKYYQTTTETISAIDTEDAYRIASERAATPSLIDHDPVTVCKKDIKPVKK